MASNAETAIYYPVSPGKLIALSVLTLGLYEIYWFYKHWQQIQANLPGYRLSKFQPLMPQWVEQEVLFDYLLDRRGAERWLQAIDG